MKLLRKTPLFVAGVVLIATLLLGLIAPPLQPVVPAQPVASESGSAASGDIVTPLPEPPALPAAKVALGERLFKEPRLSRDNSLACASCHRLEAGGVDHRPVSIGVGGAVGNINAPTVFNSALQFAQFWDGRAATLEEQAAGPVHNPVEMASNWEQVIAKLSADEGYRQAFAALYPDGITAANIVDAIATFERTLITPNARFDRFLRGEQEALTALELKGWQRFRELGCASCHQGRLLGGNMFQKFGVLRDYFSGRPITAADLGRYNVTRREEDRHVFKVPSLRNVALTAPYFHDASAADLPQAVAVMGRHQLGRDLSHEDIEAIVAFLHTLTGEWRGKPLQ
ncbi:MAG: cytochrome-c peroxidase [Rhodocyclaceae bacterium]|nr:cytochrome-c peroxidase [Rhodocyclaceae bacterium]